MTDAVAAPAVDTSRLTKVFVKIRDARSALKAEFTRKDDELKEQQRQIRVALLQHLLATKSDNVGTEFGTAYKSEDWQAGCSDWAIFHEFCREHDLLNLMEKRVSVAALREYMENNGGRLPPGVSLHREVTVNVRRK